MLKKFDVGSASMKLRKCEFAKASYQQLGNQISSARITPPGRKIKTKDESNAPRNRKQLVSLHSLQRLLPKVTE